MTTTPLDRLTDALLRWLARELSPYLPPKRPLPLSVRLTGQEGPMLVYEVAFPPVGAPDVVTRKLSVTIDGTTTDHDFGVADASHQVRCQEGQVVVLSLVDVDEQGNASLPSEPFSFTGADTLAPPAPGSLGATLVSEEADEPPTPPDVPPPATSR